MSVQHGCTLEQNAMGFDHFLLAHHDAWILLIGGAIIPVAILSITRLALALRRWRAAKGNRSHVGRLAP